MDFIPFFLVIGVIFYLGALGVLDGDAADGDSLRSFAFWVSWFALVALAAFRTVGVGSDDEAYVDIFSRIPSIIDCTGWLCGYDYHEINVEFGFFGLLSVLHLIGDSNFVLFFFVAASSVYFNLKSIRFFSRSFCGGVLIYFCHFYLAKELNAIRVGLATAIAFVAVKYLYQKRRVLFLVLVILAGTIHVSSLLVFLPAVLALLAPQRRILVLLSVGVLVAASSFDLSKSVTPLIGVDFLSEKMALYSGAQEYNYKIPLFDLVNVRNLIVVALGLLYWERLKGFDERFQFLFYFFLSATLFRILFGDFAILAGRGYAAMSMFEYAIIPLMLIFFFGRKPGFFLTFALSALTLCLNLYVSTGWSGGAHYFG